MRPLRILALATLLTSFCLLSGSACDTKAQQVFAACQQYKQARDCERRVLGRTQMAIDCGSHQSKFQEGCTKEDIQYAFESFSKDAKLLCSFTNVADVEKFKTSLDETKISEACRDIR